MTPASIRNTWKQGSWLLWPTVQCQNFVLLRTQIPGFIKTSSASEKNFQTPWRVAKVIYKFYSCTIRFSRQFSVTSLSLYRYTERWCPCQTNLEALEGEVNICFVADCFACLHIGARKCCSSRPADCRQKRKWSFANVIFVAEKWILWKYSSQLENEKLRLIAVLTQCYVVNCRYFSHFLGCYL